jgi:3-hydroxyacyl-CoA dehydrogenase/enoyl-CoA hydratase/3-hydroxybutyryl-CoA epimerase
MLYESARVTLKAAYRIARLTVTGGLDRVALEDLDAALAIAERHPALDVLVLGARGDGPDLGELAGDPAAATAIAALGQQVANKLAGLRAITVADIDGPCLGGALELALACDVRVAAGHAATRLAFPQVAAGAIPCCGTALRLPRLVGMRRALDLLLSGRKLSAAQARKAGLVRYAFPPNIARVECERVILDLQAAGRKPRRRRPLFDMLPGRRGRLLRRAWSRLRKTTSPDHKAPRELLRVLTAAMSGGEAEGLAAERAAMGRLARDLTPPSPFSDTGRGEKGLEISAPSPLGKGVGGLGHSSRRMHTLPDVRLRIHSPSPAADLAARPIRRIGVIGGGTVGVSLAQWAALHGCAVAIQERDAAAAKLGRERLARQFRRAVKRRLLPEADLADSIAAVAVGSAWVGFENADLVLEAVDEDQAVKSDVLQEAERHIKSDTLLATCSTAFTVRELQERLARPQRLLGLHVGHPAAALRWVEVTAGPITDPLAIARLRTWLRAHGKRPLLVADRPGRVLGRVLLPYLHEAVLLAEEGYDVAAVDGAICKFGLTWGPFQTMDAAGLDVVLACLRSMAATVPGLSPPPLLERVVTYGGRGKKTGGGFYRFGRPNVNVSKPSGQRNLDLAVRRSISRLLLGAFAALGSGLIRHADDLDGLLLGCGWPAFRGGPVNYAYQRGLPAVLQSCEGLARRYGPRFEPCRELRRRAGEPAVVTLPFSTRRSVAA